MLCHRLHPSPGVPVHRTLLFVPLAITACAGGGGTDSGEVDDRTPLTCDVLAADDFCWQTNVDEAYACIPEADSDGTFNGDRSVCTLGNGITIEFVEPVPADPFADSADDYLWNFTIKDAGGADCATFVDTEFDYGLTTASGTAETRASGFGMELECPDGEVFYIGNAFDLFECEGGTIPGYGYSGNVAWQLLGGAEDRFNLFNCQ